MNNSLKRIACSCLILLAAAMFVAPIHAQQRKARQSHTTGNDFFIISSVDPAKHALVLKLPTEVTMLMTVTDNTVYQDEKGKPLHFSDLRAGDTVFIEHGKNQQGEEVALRIRKGSMTVDELHRRFLK